MCDRQGLRARSSAEGAFWCSLREHGRGRATIRTCSVRLSIWPWVKTSLAWRAACATASPRSWQTEPAPSHSRVPGRESVAKQLQQRMRGES